MGKIGRWYRGLSKRGKIVVVSAVALLSLSTLGTTAPTNPSLSPALHESYVKSESTAIVKPKPQEIVKPKTKVETKTVSSTEAIPFTSTTVDDPNLEQGVTKVLTAGVNGTLTRTYQVTYTDGVETSRAPPTETITSRTVNEVIARGTKAPIALAPSCPNGTYKNSAGKEVCKPYESDGVPAGASAQCRDGTYSFSQSRRGTCSGHGGVATWL